mmetsp:Transcript_7976/g.13078  ORF Transcript_7976/g.13078 Transcript_7976/m.13078 type:complete len:210 (+) Transcript_7976:44-673(+)
MSTAVSTQSIDLDAIVTYIINHPQCLMSPAALISSFKLCMSTISHCHNIDYEKKSRKWMWIRLIPIALYYVAFYQFVKKMAKKYAANEPIRLSLVQYVGFVIAMIGHLFRMYCEQIMGHEFVFELVTSGPYRYIRHPRYAATYIYAFGDCLFLQNIFMFINLAFKILLYPARMKNEEKKLTQFFTSDISEFDYEQYKQRVPYRICPGIY